MQTLMSLICRYVNSVDVIINIILNRAPPAYTLLGLVLAFPLLVLSLNMLL